MNDYWDYLAHARKAKERDDHKYIERVPIGTNKGKTVYRYFYTEQEYQAYLNKKESEKKSTGANANESLKKVAGEVLKKAAGNKTDRSVSDSKIGAHIKVYTYVYQDPDTKKWKTKIFSDEDEYEKFKEDIEYRNASPVEKFIMDGKKFVKKASEAIKNAWSERNGKNTKEFVLDLVDRLKDEAVDTFTDKNEYQTSEVGTRVRGKTYKAKVALPNGSFKYFYSTDDYEQYLRRQEYQEESPDFMKDIPRIDEYDFENKPEAMGEINEEYDVMDPQRSQNCMYCTTAYELRMRGYDVQAADRGTDEEYQGTVFDLYNWYVDPEYKILGQWNGANLHLIEKCMALEGSMPDKKNAVQRAKEEYDDAKLNYDTVRKAEGLVGLLTKSETMLKAEAELKAASEKYQEAKAALEEAEAAYDKVRKDDDFARQLTAYNNLVSGNADSSAGLINEYYTIEQELKMYPANSRGNLMVRWVGGGGHSMIWETDTHGRVTIRDAQTNKVVFLKEILPYCTLVECVRTDNLELKEGILATVEEN